MHDTKVDGTRADSTTEVNPNNVVPFAGPDGNEHNGAGILGTETTTQLPFGPPATVEGQRRHQAAVVAAEDRKNRWKPHWFAVSSLHGLPQAWARDFARKIERQNVHRDPVTDQPKLMFCGVDAVEAGASDTDLNALPRLQPDDISALQLRAAATRQDCRKQVDTLARSIAAGRETAVSPPDPLRLDALLTEPDEDAAYRIGDMWPLGGRVLLSAQFKSGKSTLVGNVIRALVDGGHFLGKFDATPVGKVALIDTELDRRTLRRWLGDQAIRNTAAVSVLPLRGAVSTFDILDAATRSHWAQRLAGTDVVILDCLRPVIDALGLSEDKDAGRVLVAFDALLAEVGAKEGMVVTHMGHHNERARGDSRLLDWPDALWKIVRGGEDGDDDGDRPRFLSALGRDVAQPEGQLTFDASTRHLTYAGGSRKDSIDRAALPELLVLIEAEPGLSMRAATERLMDYGVPRQAARSAIEAAVKDGSVVAAPGPRRAKLLSLKGNARPSVDPFTVAAAGADDAN